MEKDTLIVVGVVVGVLVLLPVIVSVFLRDVDAGTIRLVSWLQGSTMIYRGWQIEGDPPAHHRDDHLEQGHQRRPRQYRPNGGRR